MRFKIGDRVKYSEHSLRPKRDYWLGQGREPQKSQAKGWYEDAKAVRGVVTHIISNSSVEVQTNDGCIHRSLDYVWELAKED